MQTIGLSWLVLRLTHSGTQLGLVIAAQYLPMLLFGLWGGLIADRLNKRKILYATQSIYGLLALMLGLLVISGDIRLWMVYLLAVSIGFVTVVDNPSRQTFVVEMVGKDSLKNAITLNSTMVNAARIIGPAIAAVLIATVGLGPCFIINALSFIAVLIALLSMDKTKLRPTPRLPKEPGQIKAGLVYAFKLPRLRSTLIMMFIIGTFAYEFPVILPLFATVTLHGNATTYSLMTVAMGIGAIGGGLYAAGKAIAGRWQLMAVSLIFGLSIMLAAVMPGLKLVFVVLIAVGALSVIFISLGNTTLQLTSEPEMRGRVMSLWAIAFAGTTPIGGPIIGYISDHSNPRIGLAVGGISAVLAAGLGLVALGYRRSIQIA
jgi:MFS family permease